MPIVTYEVISHVTNTKRPFLDKNGLLLFYTIGAHYRYYIECARTSDITYEREYFILISNKKFDDNCRKCFVDSYGRCRIKPSGELKDYITTQTINRNNIDIEYIESTNEYDVYKLE